MFRYHLYIPYNRLVFVLLAHSNPPVIALTIPIATTIPNTVPITTQAITATTAAITTNRNVFKATLATFSALVNFLQLAFIIHFNSLCSLIFLSTAFIFVFVISLSTFLYYLLLNFFDEFWFFYS